MLYQTSFIVAVIVLTVAHIVALSSTVYRFQFRYSNSVKFGWDDVFALLSTVGDAYMLGLLISNVNQESLGPFQYRLTLAAYFFTIWMSRATLVMTLVRICLTSPALRKQAFIFSVVTSGLVIAAIVYTIISVLFCKTSNTNCVNFKLCFCRLPLEITVSAVIADFVVDTGAIYASRALLQGDDNPAESVGNLSRKRFLLMGFSSSLLTLATNSAFWLTYILAARTNYTLYMSLANSVAAICILTFNIPLIAGILCQRIYPWSPDFMSYPNMTLTEISDRTITDFTPPNDPEAST